MKLCLFFFLAAMRVGTIEYFGYSGIDLAKVRAAMPLHEGDTYSDKKKPELRRAVSAAIGKDPTDIAAVCCSDGKMLIYIGLPGSSYHPFPYNPAPTGRETLPAELMKLSDDLDRAAQKAVRKGGDGASEDDSNGYALFKDPEAQAIQMKYRAWALQHEAEVLKVLESAASTEHRRLASEVAGYVQQSPTQISALVRAARDSDDEVRNNATRALGVLVRSNAKLAAQIPPETFIEMLNSGHWTDRNKGASLLMALTDDRDPALLQKLRSQAFDSLVEMASWRGVGHAWFARILLGRIAKIPEDELRVMASRGADEILAAARKNP
jgi:hypothetical protein